MATLSSSTSAAGTSEGRRSFERSLSSLSIASFESESSMDWDRSIPLDELPTTPRNSVAFPLNVQDTPLAESVFPVPSNTPAQRATTPRTNGTGTPERKAPSHARAGSQGTRTLSDLLRKHADGQSKFEMDQEEAKRVGDVLRGWINSSLSPYEADDEEWSSFASTHKDDLYVPSSTRRIDAKGDQGSWGRMRGMSESQNLRGSRSPSSAA